MDKFNQTHYEEIVRLISSSVHQQVLRHELIDHCCCAVEDKLAEGKNYHKALRETMEELAPQGLHHIEEQVAFITNPQIPFTMKITQYFFGFLATVCIILGLTFKIMHWPFATALLFIGNVSLITSMLTVLTSVIQFPKQHVSRIRSTAGALGAISFSAGSIFKIMYWPGANVTMLLGVLLIVFIFTPLFFWQLYKNDHVMAKSNAS